ncbi:MAG TPA: replication-relaxation family protein, partial [Candidatus Saccharimonadales bacterium]|nr:replication-relaxation family protein [Candidatus Saccharimonadales bacterium]
MTSRDLAVLTALHEYRYLDREQVERLFFQGRRRAQLRLQELRSRGLIIGWRCLLQPGLHPRPSVYVLAAAGARLLAHATSADPRPLIARAR